MVQYHTCFIARFVLVFKGTLAGVAGYKCTFDLLPSKLLPSEAFMYAWPQGLRLHYAGTCLAGDMLLAKSGRL